MNKKTLFVLGTFWIFIVALVSASSVAADGMYWGDSVGVADDPLIVDEPVFFVPKEVPVFEEPVFSVLSGMYWGD